MGYQIRSIPFGNTIAHNLYHSESGEALQILPAYGGQLHQLHVLHKGKLFPLLNSYHNSTPLENGVHMDYKGAKLSPFPNRLQKGLYSFKGNQYQLPCNDNGHNALHGFLWDYPFSLKDVRLEDESAEITLSMYYEGKKAGYPFPFSMDITYTLSPQKLSVLTQIENKGDKAMPIGDGWHPYFLLPGGTDQWQLKLPTQKRLKTDQYLIPTGDYEEYLKFKSLNTIQGEALDHCFGPLTERISETILYHPKEELKIIVWQKSGTDRYEWLNVYIPPDKNSIAIEPMSCAPDAFNNGLGNIHLPAGESRTFTFGVRI